MSGPDAATQHRIARIVAQLQHTAAVLTATTATDVLVLRAISDAEDAARVIETAQLSATRAEVTS